MLRSLLTTGMGRMTLMSGIAAFAFPAGLVCLNRRYPLKKWLLVLILFLYGTMILYLAVLKRRADIRQINLTPFWSYGKWSQADVRWQVYMNVFAFIPFGFLLTWATDRRFWQIALAGFAFSLVIEACQFIFCLGYSEFDDLWHNTWGTAIGCGYCRLQVWLRRAYGGQIDRLRRQFLRGVLLSAAIVRYGIKAIAASARPWIRLTVPAVRYGLRRCAAAAVSAGRILAEIARHCSRGEQGNML